ncbi:stage V sporulation protein B [Paenibacillus sp. SC116]|uniref:stage V sporulation protein B n=1 Tax=Paenibacillus sp. SC116 TaxID=2968986 RepID=UPI00215AD0D6|nr:stage V sporulation protein B [Paenibacillus sp. SC116]MCR8845998.1 stage V sporulation protein B [Paenibacillus sp. SC116]
MKKQTFIQGTLILFAAGLLNRILGFIPRITLPRIIGAEGVGLYQLGYPFLLVMLTIITGGVPLAVAKLVAEADSVGNQQRVRSIVRAALWMTSSVAIVLTVTSLTLSSWITTHVLTDDRVYYTFLFMTPNIIIIAVASVLRGYFQGKQNMIPTAASQVTETLVRIVTVIGGAYLLLPYGLEWAAAGAMLGVVVGELSGLLVLVLQWRRHHKKKDGAIDATANNVLASQPVEQERPAWRSLVRIALPVTGGKLIGSLSYLLESITIARSLAAAGIVTAVATAQYGALQGMIIPILLLPGALTYSLSVSLVPSLSEAYGRKDMATIHMRMHQAIRLALVSGAPFAVVMYILALPLCSVLYDDISVAPMLQWMAPVAIFIYLQAPLQAALQALDRPGMALMNTFVGAIVKLGLIIQLASMPHLGIQGAVIAINVNILIVTLLHGWSLIRTFKIKITWIDFAKVGVAMIIIAGAIQATYQHFPLTNSVFVRLSAACLVGLCLYVALLIMMRLIDRNDLTRLPLIGRFLSSRT